MFLVMMPVGLNILIYSFIFSHLPSHFLLGKVEVTGVEEIMGRKAFVFRFLQCRDEAWIGRPFFAKYDPKAVWFDDLEPLPGMELPWDKNGLPRPIVPSVN
jgi:hypothetical protein